jgi:hypothetical protein
LSQACHKKAPSKQWELPDLRRLSVPVTIENTNQDNIAVDLGNS